LRSWGELALSFIPTLTLPFAGEGTVHVGCENPDRLLPLRRGRLGGGWQGVAHPIKEISDG